MSFTEYLNYENSEGTINEMSQSQRRITNLPAFENLNTEQPAFPAFRDLNILLGTLQI